MDNQFKKAFTLAEVLITLGIIGVVAAMTIPTLMNQTGDAELKSAYKKEASIVQQAFMQVVNDNGGSILGAYADAEAGSEAFKNDMKAKLKTIKDCSGTASWGGTGTTTTANECWHGANQWKYLTGVLRTDDNDRPGLVLSDGGLIIFDFQKADCSFNMVPYNGNYKRCGFINFDVNGAKKPNTVGKDIFNINILPDRLVLEGALPVDASKVCLASGDGWDCGAKFMTGEK